jgi:hypothetical protein
MGGGKEDHHEPGLEHWSLAVKDGKALENEWCAEIPIPCGGPHRWICVPSVMHFYVIDRHLFLSFLRVKIGVGCGCLLQLSVGL